MASGPPSGDPPGKEAGGGPPPGDPPTEAFPILTGQPNNQRCVNAAPAPKKKPGGKKPSMKFMKKVNSTPSDPAMVQAQQNAKGGCQGLVTAHLEALALNPQKIQITEEDLDFVELLGKGAAATVKLMRHKESGVLYAVKSIQASMILDSANGKMIQSELSSINYSFAGVLEAYAAFMAADKTLNVVQEYMDRGSLQDVLGLVGPLPEDVLQICCLQVITGLHSLHTGTSEGDVKKQRFVHRDVKPANLLVSSKGQVKLADFGMATTSNTIGLSTFVGTTTYMSPERIRGHRYDTASDVWSAGLTFVQLATGQYPFPCRNFLEVLNLITNAGKLKLPDYYSNTAKDFLWGTTAPDASERLDTEGCLNHPFLQRQNVKLDNEKFSQWLAHYVPTRPPNAELEAALTAGNAEQNGNSAPPTPTPPGR